MKPILFGALFFTAIPWGWAHELGLDPNPIIKDVGVSPQCERCNQAESAGTTSFDMINAGYFGSEEAICTKNDGGHRFQVRETCPNGRLMNGGFDFKSSGGHTYMDNAQCVFADALNKPQRTFEFVSYKRAINDTYIRIEDACGAGSYNVKSEMFLLPRKTVPSMEVNGNQAIVTLATGETVTMNAQTAQIMGGALTEGAPDFNPNRHARRPPNVRYTGAGISMTMSHRFEFPRIGSDVIEIRQGNKSCSPRRSLFFSSAGVLLTNNDDELVRAINRACPGKNFTINI